MKKLLLILILSFYFNGISHSIDVPIIKSGSFVELKSRGGKTNDYTITFFDNNKCTYSYWDLWTTTYEDCYWKQEGPNVEIRMGKGGMLGRFSGGNYIDYFVTTALSNQWSGFLNNYTHIWKDCISKEERERLAEQKRIAEEKKWQDEYQKDLEKRTKEYENSLKNNNSKLYKTNSGRAEALNLLSFKTSTALNGFLGGIIGLIFGIGIYSILDKKRKKKVNDKVFFGVFFFLGWILVKLF